MWFFPKLLPQSLKHSIVLNVYVCCSIKTIFYWNQAAKSCPNRTVPLGTMQGPWRHGLPTLEWKNPSGLHRALILNPPNTINWNANSVTDHLLLSQLLWLNEHKFCKSSKRPSQKTEGCYSSREGADSILVPIRCSVMRCPLTFVLTIR